jgi:hypothetical protein
MDYKATLMSVLIERRLDNEHKQSLIKSIDCY